MCVDAKRQISVRLAQISIVGDYESATVAFGDEREFHFLVCQGWFFQVSINRNKAV